MIAILYSPIGFAVTSPLLVYLAYSIWRDGLRWVPATLRGVKWLAIGGALVVFLNLAIFVGEFAYVVGNPCDNMKISPGVVNQRDDIAEARLEACTLIGTVENHFVTLQIHVYPRFYPRKTLIGYSPVGDHDPVLRWIDDNTLSVHLGKVSWVSSRLDKVGNVRIIYSYAMVD